MEKKITVKERITEFWNRHKVTIISSVMFVGGLLIGSSIKKAGESSYDDLNVIPFPEKKTLSKSEQKIKYIDADIFTRLAPFIEESVLEEGVDESYTDVTYEVDHPKGGDPKNGYYTESKKVEVKVYDVTEP